MADVSAQILGILADNDHVFAPLPRQCRKCSTKFDQHVWPLRGDVYNCPTAILSSRKCLTKVSKQSQRGYSYNRLQSRLHDWTARLIPPFQTSEKEGLKGMNTATKSF